MLILGRKKGLSIIIDHSLNVTVSAIRKDHVLISIHESGSECFRLEKISIGQKVDVGHSATLLLTAIRGTQVSLGVIAPREINVAREEIYVK